MISAEMITEYVVNKIKDLMPVTYSKDRLVLESTVLSNQITTRDLDKEFEWFCKEYLEPIFSADHKWEKKILPLHNSFRNLLFSLPEPSGFDFCNKIDRFGWSVRVVRGFSIEEDAFFTRIDILYGVSLEEKYSIEGGQ